MSLPAAGAFLPTRDEIANDKRQAEARADASAARVAELEALIAQMRRGQRDFFIATAATPQRLAQQF